MAKYTGTVYQQRRDAAKKAYNKSLDKKWYGVEKLARWINFTSPQDFSIKWSIKWAKEIRQANKGMKAAKKVYDNPTGLRKADREATKKQAKARANWQKLLKRAKA